MKDNMAKFYFIVFEKQTGKVVGKTYDERIALSYIENGNGKYDYQSYEEKEIST